ncbi:MAG TPA: DoxX family protein [Geminicoccaceae bacterium]|nr:DoxX family protein [Geminicoccus sp.]HMU51614.1 DoxX family protein [Geminicoccaceae bacterium]
MTDTTMGSTPLAMPALGRLYAALSPLTLPLLRVTTGLLLMPHGAQKLFGALGGYGLSGTGQFFESIGYSPGVLWALVVGTVELFGGLALALGLATRIAAALAFVVLVNAVLFHLPNGPFVGDGGYELALLWAVAALVFAVRGGGRLSLDRVLGREV